MVTPHSLNSNFKTISPFAMSSSRSKKEDKEQEILEVFKKVELNIPFINVIKQIHKRTGIPYKRMEGFIHLPHSHQSKCMKIKFS